MPSLTKMQLVTDVVCVRPVNLPHTGQFYSNLLLIHTYTSGKLSAEAVECSQPEPEVCRGKIYRQRGENNGFAGIGQGEPVLSLYRISTAVVSP